MRADLWLAREDPDPEVLVVGVPLTSDPGATRADLSPLVIRDRFERLTTRHTDPPVDIARITVRDLGNWPVSELGPGELGDHLIDLAQRVPEAPLIVYLGGDTSITGPLVSALRTDPQRVGLVRFSSQPSPDEITARPENTVQIGARPFDGGRDDKCAAVFTVSDVEHDGARVAAQKALAVIDDACDVIYVHVDMAVVDKAFVPGAHRSGPGGLHPSTLAEAVKTTLMHPRAAVVDLVGVDPQADLNALAVDTTAYVFLSAVAGFACR